MPTIEIDGQKFAAEAGQTVIEVADQHGIHIPRFCYHPKLSVAANCRMCLVEVENARKPMPACATPVADGMKVMTRSKATRHSQKAVMEFLLINHPLDCPICDQGGQCELQDLAVGYGYESSQYEESKTSAVGPDLGPLVATAMTRCIQCTRCVRFGEEVAGLRELGATGRGENMQIGTYVRHFMKSEVSGNIIDICPVGALLSKPFLYQARAWELAEQPGVAAHDCFGSQTYVHTRRGKLMRVVPRECEEINQSWLSDRDRFSYLGLAHEERALQPQIKQDGAWHEVSWEKALAYTVERLSETISRHGNRQIATLASPSSTTEECYLLQKLWRKLGSNHIDHRLRCQDVSDQERLPLFLGAAPWREIERQQAVLLIGSNLRDEQPLAAIRIRQAQRRGAKLMNIGALDCRLDCGQSDQMIVKPGDMVDCLAQVAKSLSHDRQVDQSVTEYLRDIAVGATAEKIARTLSTAEHSLLMLGTLAHAHPQAATIRNLSAIIAELSNSNISFLTEGANSTGAQLAGVIPHRLAGGEGVSSCGMSATEMLHKPVKAYLTLGIEPEVDCLDGHAALAALTQAEFVLCVNPYCTETMRAYADVILPAAAFAETAGTFFNAEGRRQSFRAAVLPPGEAQPAWKILCLLARTFAMDDFSYENRDAVLDEFLRHCPQSAFTPQMPSVKALREENLMPTAKVDGLQLLMETPIYATDAVVRRAEPLQRVFADDIPQACVDGVARLHPETAMAAQLRHGDTAKLTYANRSVQLPVLIEERVARGCVCITPDAARNLAYDGGLQAVRIENVS